MIKRRSNQMKDVLELQQLNEGSDVEASKGKGGL
ncbi:class III lanthipeptide, partial [Bacillus halotolerans]